MVCEEPKSFLMPPRRQATCLELLALEALGKFLYSFGHRLLIADITRSLAEMALQHLQMTLHRGIPPRLANDITAHLLTRIRSMISEICYSNRDTFSQKVFDGLICAVIHPALTKLDCNFDCRYLNTVVYKRLWILKRLKVLRLYDMKNGDEDLIMSGLRGMEGLETFIFERNCTDNILNQVSESCSSLVCLDVSGSEFVTDVSIECVLKLRHLEHLNLFGTSVSRPGYLELMSGLAGSSGQLLKLFGCSNVADVDVIVEKFPELETLKLGAEQCDVTVMRGLKRLQQLGLCCAKFIDFTDCLHVIGAQLAVLELHNCKGIEISSIAANCPALQTFKLFSCSYSTISHQVLKTCSPGFFELKFLTIDKSSKYPAYFNVDRLILRYILSRSFGIRVINVESYADFDETFITSVFGNNGFSELEELSMHATYSAMLPLGCVRLFLDRCSNLSIVNISGAERSGDRLDDFLSEVRDAFPHISVVVESRSIVVT